MEKEKPVNPLKSAFQKLKEVKDTPHRTAFSFALGVFLGILPGTGPIAALTAAHFLRMNRPIAVLGSLVTNTWLSILTFTLSIRFGASIIGSDWHSIYQEWLLLTESFSWEKLFAVSFLKIAAPVVIGYTVISIVIAIASYSLIAVFLTLVKNREKYGR